MNYNEFVCQLERLCPSTEDFASLGYNNPTIVQRIKSYKCNKYSNALSLSFAYSNNPILQLLSQYDCSNIEIGTINFIKKYEEKNNYFIIGKMELDILILNKSTLQIEVVDYLDDENIMYSCASNSSSFLESIFLCADFFSKRIKDPSLAMNSDFTYNYLILCMEKAGGEKYSEFYKILLGYEE